MKIKPLRRLNQADLSNSVVHFTGRVGKGNTDVPEEIRRMDSRQRLAGILEARQINAYETFFSCGDPVVCLTEATLEGMRTLVAGGRYEAWGLEFSKDYIFQRGGGPAYYIRGDQWDSFAASDLKSSAKAFGTPYWPGVDWEPLPGNWIKTTLDTPNQWVHEREWRVPINAEKNPCALPFELGDVVSIIAPTTAEGEEFKMGLPEGIRTAGAALAIVGLAETGLPREREIVVTLPLLDYESALAAFKRLQPLLKAFPGPTPVVIQMARSGGGVRQVTTTFKAAASMELRAAVMNELAGVVTDVTFR